MTPEESTNSHVEMLLRLGDNSLILGHRLSEWCGHGPVLEEDLALTNIALDLVGQTRLWLDYAGEVEGQGRDADALAYRRDIWGFRNVLLVEQPNGDFADTIARQFYFDSWHNLLLESLTHSNDPRIAAIAEKTLKEAKYHIKRSGMWLRTLGDGTDESHSRMQRGLSNLWAFAGELFIEDQHDRNMLDTGIGVNLVELKSSWLQQVRSACDEATLTLPENEFAHKGGKTGTHTEHLGYILADMQFLQRAYPDATW
jgi:ring-1,2-phenylacetyl-CoA epoxidase subunit PaaC